MRVRSEPLEERERAVSVEWAEYSEFRYIRCNSLVDRSSAVAGRGGKGDEGGGVVGLRFREGDLLRREGLLVDLGAAPS